MLVAVGVRPAGPRDARAVAEVHVSSWQWAYRDQMPDEYLDSLSVDEREVTWRRRLDGRNHGVVVATDGDGNIVGFASIGRCSDDDAAEGTGELEAIYVTKEVAGTGTGRALADAAMQLLRESGFDRATLWVLETNGRARDFYERAGWQWDGARSDHQVQCMNLPIVRYSVTL